MITIKTPEEIEIMTEGGKILAKIMKELERKVKPGVTTEELDKVAEDLVLKYGGKCSFKGYERFPACLCTSINEEIVHAVPSARRLKEGDILSLDLGIFYRGFHTDMAVTLPVLDPSASRTGVGKVRPEISRLIRVTKKSLETGIKKIKPGNHIGDIGYAIQKYVKSQGFNVVRELCGHGIGRELHEEPEILNYGKKRTGPELVEGMVFCLEPMVTVGDWRIKKSKDGHGWKTKDDSLSCHFEHTIVVTKNGPKILTRR
jgi:methionyl aminopeptidase